MCSKQSSHSFRRCQHYIRRQPKKKAWKHPLNIFEPLQKQKWETPFLRRLPLDEATPMMSSSPSPSPSMTFGRLEGLVTAAPLRSTSSLSRSSLISAMDTERFFCCSRVWRRISRRSWDFGETWNKGDMVNHELTLGKPTEFLVVCCLPFFTNFEGDRTKWQNEF